MIIIILYIALAIATIALYLIKRSEPRNPMSFYESMKLVKLPIITFKIGNEDINLLFDSGGMRNFIDSRVVELMQLPHEEGKNEKKVAVYGITGNVVENKVIHMNVQYKGMDFDDDFVSQDLSGSMDALKEEYGVRIHGLLGTGFMHKYNYVLDFQKLIAYSKE